MKFALPAADEELDPEAVRLREARSWALGDHAANLARVGSPDRADLAMRSLELRVRLGHGEADHARHLALRRRRWWWWRRRRRRRKRCDAEQVEAVHDQVAELAAPGRVSPEVGVDPDDAVPPDGDG